MPLQTTEQIELGEFKVTNKRTTVYVVQNIGTSIALVIYDMENKVGGLAHIVLPESTLSRGAVEELPAKYADLAIPHLLDEYQSAGGQKRNASIRMVGGAQLFNFGGGGGNILNIGTRNATAIRTALSKLGLTVDEADIGGNKTKNLRFVLATGQLVVSQVGGPEYLL